MWKSAAASIQHSPNERLPAKIEQFWEAMTKVFGSYFPHGGPTRTTVAVAALPGDSLVEINRVPQP